jgi:hypothetical protein
VSAEAERERLERAWPEAFRDSVRAAFGVLPPEREPGGYPKGFHSWPLEKRNAYFAGFNFGFIDRRRRRGGCQGSRAPTRTALSRPGIPREEKGPRLRVVTKTAAQE